MIPLDQCEKGVVYRLHSRNLAAGVYDGEGGFIGIREKFDSRYLFTEIHYEASESFGTARPLEKIGDLRGKALIKERWPGQCHHCGEQTKFVEWPEEEQNTGSWEDGTHKGKGYWVHSTGPDPSECPKVFSVGRQNEHLFGLLEEIEGPERGS